ncbi:uncharacterized protein K452DRAFT_326694 [Aplosporella prunicola CBS 121167]|uniref:Methyltransferase-domain-containing protein n=1 Tax=Aplosporella prunicola CBS 121167 TaxID=1176127 RepID=A0A6A6BDH0_9PEZI|nr:uncharacterized protein K452DRAFT_326694 [Aplosporella prunicola CBS 121167]KAF2142229.1 hypothetical protein K452DRAFT_326694 [Aplosporella prunicola CBS 121167]
MRYVRFLKVPKTDGKTLNALITITSDLGEDFLAENVTLAATIRSADDHGDIYLRKRLEWTAGMRSLPVSFDLRHCDLDWPIRVQVGARGTAQTDLFGEHEDDHVPSLISAWSASLDVPRGIKEAEKKVERRFTPLSRRTLSIWEETGESIARHVWDAGVGLAAFFDKTIALQYDIMPLLDTTLSSATYKKLNVIELGAGCGIVGISLAQLIPDCRVTLTDLPEAQEIAERNIKGMNPAMSSQVKFEPLDWEEELPENIAQRPYDLIIVSDCTYNPDSSPALVKTLHALTKRCPKAIVVLAMKVRHSSEAVFFDLLQQADIMTAASTWMAIPTDPGDYESAKKIDIYIFHSKARPKSAETPSMIPDPSIVAFWQQ